MLAYGVASKTGNRELFGSVPARELTGNPPKGGGRPIPPLCKVLRASGAPQTHTI